MSEFDFSNIRVRQEKPRPLDPIDIFHAASVADPNINDLWLAQGDALREWHANRHSGDLAVVLNTGAGKTLVGLLIAQSLVNETMRQVVYACSSIQLVEQTAEKARSYGLDVSTYHSGQFSTDLYTRGMAPCVTTYQALFNGKTIFRRHDISSIIFDDAHTAEHALRDQFSLNISREGMVDTYMAIVNLFHEYHRSIGRASSYAELLNGQSQRLFLVPPFVNRANVAELRRILLDAGLDQHISTMFAWEHIRDHEELCCLLISDSAVTLTPATVPVSSLPYFRNDVRRVYLSATLEAPDAFAKAFGRIPGKVIAPATTAGECERMILIPRISNDESTDVESAISIIREHKALILVPTYRRSEEWNKVALLPAPTDVTEAFSTFRNASAPEKLIMVARFDGIDLPGDTCRVLVIDDLPTGTGPLERFQWDSLGMQSSYRSIVASRIVQSFGRISRGMSDHGVILLTGEKLVDWLKTPLNRSLLPPFLQKQIKVGESISENAPNANNLASAANACLSRAEGWISSYAENMRADVAGGKFIDPAKTSSVAIAESDFGFFLWNRDYERAVRRLDDKVLNSAFEISQNTGAWLTLWLGYAMELTGDYESAHRLYARAYSLNSNIPPVSLDPILGTGGAVPTQVMKVARQMEIRRSSDVRPPRSIEDDLRYLDGTGSPAQTEEALRSLGQYLGLDSIRPEKEFGTDPDVLWTSEDGPAVCIELKTDKQHGSTYRKDDVGQLANHVQWCRDNTEAVSIVPLFVGPLVPASDEASPSPKVLVMELAQFYEVSRKLRTALQDSASDALPLTLANRLNEVFGNRQLLWPGVFEELSATALRDI